MNLNQLIQEKVSVAIKMIYDVDVDPSTVQIQLTRKEFEGDLTVVVFPFTRYSRKSPEQTAQEIGVYLSVHVDEISRFNGVKGFLNLKIAPGYWLHKLSSAFADPMYGIRSANPDAPLAMVEYSSPNTNKPLHLGHIRNNLLGFSIAEILKANAWKVIKTNIVNDRGIHICKSMYAWLMDNNRETPESSGKKGDHLVGDYYVKFDQLYKREVARLVQEGMEQEKAEKEAPSMLAVREMLRKWEENDPEIRQLWKTMNAWVYAGFDITYKRLGVDFDKIYYESDTYEVGKSEVIRGLNEGVFSRHNDGSVWVDLENEGLDQKILLRSDGTSVYITQDIGTAKLRYEDYPIERMVYVVGNEQNYHFQVLSLVLDKLGYCWGKDLHHFSYGMVELPQGKMKSREGTVVDADDLMDEMLNVARKTSEELGKLDDYEPAEKEDIYRMIALGALKYFILKVDPKKTMMFNPEESIDFNGNTGPFIQYTYARIRSVLRKAKDSKIEIASCSDNLEVQEKELILIKRIDLFPDIVREAGEGYNPALIAAYCYDLAREFNQFYHDLSILNEPDPDLRNFRLILTETSGKIIQQGFALLGIECPERM